MRLRVVEFERDPAKSSLNLQKHGIDFSEAQALWENAGFIMLPSTYPDELRFLAIGMILQTHHTAVFTERGTKIRIISVRRSRDNERILYEQNQT